MQLSFCQTAIVDTNFIRTAEYYQLIESKDSLMFFDDEKTTFTGKCISKSSSGKLLKIIYYKDGCEIGVIEYYENGYKKSESFYQGHKSLGIATMWFANGNKKQEIEFENGQEIRRSEWYENGNQKTNEIFKNGKKHGLWTEWYSTGIKKLEGDYENDERVGTWTKWLPSGKIDKERVFTK